jgi:DNA polymerase-3 subunit delta'
MQSFLIKTSTAFLQQPIDKKLIIEILTLAKLTDPAPKLADVQVISPDGTTIKIEQIRRLITELSYKSRATTPRVFILWSAEAMTIPAQNALLKSLEEPPENTYLILATAQPEVLLPTVRSRCQTITATDQSDINESTTEITNQILATISNPSTTYSNLIDLASKYGDREQALELIKQLMEAVHQQPDYPNPSAIKNLQILIQAQTDLKANVNVKLTLENCLFRLKKPILSP